VFGIYHPSRHQHRRQRCEVLPAVQRTYTSCSALAATPSAYPYPPGKSTSSAASPASPAHEEGTEPPLCPACGAKQILMDGDRICFLCHWAGVIMEKRQTLKRRLECLGDRVRQKRQRLHVIAETPGVVDLNGADYPGAYSMNPPLAAGCRDDELLPIISTRPGGCEAEFKSPSECHIPVPVTYGNKLQCEVHQMTNTLNTGVHKGICSPENRGHETPFPTDQNLPTLAEGYECILAANPDRTATGTSPHSIQNSVVDASAACNSENTSPKTILVPVLVPPTALSTDNTPSQGLELPGTEPIKDGELSEWISAQFRGWN